jgi:hypothetical protein
MELAAYQSDCVCVDNRITMTGMLKRKTAQAA